MKGCALALLAILLGAGCTHVTREERGEPQVASLRIDGARAIPPEEIRKRLETQGRYEPTAWFADLQRIVRIYQTYGYYQARVVAHSETLLPGGKMALEVKVVEGEPVRIASVQITGLDALSADERRQLMADFPLRQGAVLLEANWTGVRRAFVRRLEDFGFAEAVVDAQARVYAPGHEAKIYLKTNLGQRFRFGETVVVSHPTPKVGVAPIVAAAQAVAEPGELFSRTTLDAVQKRVYQLGVFDSVQVAPGPPDRKTGRVGVLIDVKESPLHEVRLGGGLGVEPARNEVHGLVKYIDRSFFGGVRRLRIQAIGGYAFVPDVFAVIGNDVAQAPQSAPFADGTIAIEQPQFFSSELQGFVTAEVQRGVEQAYRFFGVDLSPGLVWQPTDPLSLRFGYHFGWNRFDSPWPLTPAQEQLAYGCPEPCRLSYFEQFLQWDRRDNPVEPMRGYALGLRVREEGGPLGGSGAFVQVMPQVRGYVTPDAAERWTVAGRLMFGATVHASSEPVPILLRLFSGGAQSMRGFGYHRLSPLLVVPRNDPGATSGVTIPVGGDGLVEASLELRYRLSVHLTLATFMDVGAVTPQRLSLAPGSLADELQWAIGAGARYATPVGPVRLDLAWRPPIGSSLSVSQLPGETLTYPAGSGCFGLGSGSLTGAGGPEGACAVHLTIGESF